MKTASSNPKIQKALELLMGKILNLRLSLDSNKDNLFVRSITEDALQISNEIYDFAKGMFSRILAHSMIAITGFSIRITLLIKFENEILGSVLFTKRNNENEFSNDEVKLLKLIVDQFGISIAKAKLIESISNSSKF
jgi:hypothetical protein